MGEPIDFSIGLFFVGSVMAFMSFAIAIAKRRGLETSKFVAIGIFLPIAAIPAAAFWPKGSLPDRPITGNIIVGLIGTLITVGTIYLSSVSPTLFASRYDCGNLIPEMTDLSDQNTAPGGIKLIGVLSPKETASSTDLVECTGTAKWSDGSESGLTYSAKKQEDQWRLQYTPGP